MPAHVHAARMMEFAEDAAQYERPWEHWEYLNASSQAWAVLISPPTWGAQVQYRRKPKVIKIGERDIPAPETVAPKRGTNVFMPHLHNPNGYAVVSWMDAPSDHAALKLGLIHMTHERAQEHCAALLYFTRDRVQHER